MEENGVCVTYRIELLAATETQINEAGDRVPIPEAHRWGHGPIMGGDLLASGTPADALNASQQRAGGNVVNAWGIWVIPGGTCADRGKEILDVSRLTSRYKDPCDFTNCLINTARIVGQAATEQRVGYFVPFPNSNSFAQQVMSMCYSEYVDLPAESKQSLIENAPGFVHDFVERAYITRNRSRLILDRQQRLEAERLEAERLEAERLREQYSDPDNVDPC